MPRDGSGNYTLPAGTVAVSGALANSTHVNSRFSDLEADANAARPVSAGGTGATSASAARTALGLGSAISGTAGTDGNLVSWNGSGEAVDSGLSPSGSDTNVITGTAGTDGYVPTWNADGDIVDGYEVPDDNDFANSPAGLARRDNVQALISASSPFTEEYQSTAQTMVTAGLLTLAHGLSSQPKLIRLYAKCTTAEEGYSVGDNFDITAVMSRGTVGADDRTFSVRFDATEIKIRNGNSANFANSIAANSGNAAPLSRANWELYVEAWA